MKAVLDRIGDMDWMQIAIRPAKPFAFGVLDGTPVLGLPGNPVSSIVSFELLARPALRRMAGHADLDRPRVRAVADDDLAPPARRQDALRCGSRTAFDGTPSTSRRSAARAATSSPPWPSADGLAVLPDGDGVAAGDAVDVLLLAAEVTSTRSP